MAGEATVIVDDKKPEAAATEAPTKEALVTAGWSEAEIAAAEKRGMVKKPEEKKAEEKKEEPKPEAKKEEPEDKKPEAEKPGVIPGVDVELTQAQEKVLLDTFGPGTSVRALYLRQKKERHARQSAQERLRVLEAENKTLKDLAGKQPAKEEDGDLEDRPLTMRALREMQERQNQEALEKQGKTNGRAGRLAEAHAAQEEYAKASLADFDQVTDLAKEVLQAMANPEKLGLEPRAVAKLKRLAKDFQEAALQADAVDLDGYTAAFIAYEIGQLHPKYGKKPEANKTGEGKKPEANKTGEDKSPKGDGDPKLTPEQMERVKKNSQRTGSSASVTGGGGKTVVAAEDVTAEQLNGMSYKARQDFRQKYPEHYARLVRG